MRLLRDILLIYRRQVRQSLRVPMTLVLGLLQPILYLLFFGPVFSQVSKSFGTEATGLELFVPGILVQLGMFSSAFVGFGIIAELRQGIIERFRVTPVSRLALLLGRVLRDASLLGLQGCVLLLLARALGLVTRQEFVFAPFLNMVLVPVLLLSGILLPMTMAPDWLRTLSRFNPLSHIVDAIRDAFLGRYLTLHVVGGTLAVMALAVVSVTLATRLFLRENA